MGLPGTDLCFSSAFWTLWLFTPGPGRGLLRAIRAGLCLWSFNSDSDWRLDSRHRRDTPGQRGDQGKRREALLQKSLNIIMNKKSSSTRFLYTVKCLDCSSEEVCEETQSPDTFREMGIISHHFNQDCSNSENQKTM